MSAEIGGFLSLCKKAGKLTCGVEGVRNAVRCGKAELVLYTPDASDNSKKRVRNLCAYYSVDVRPIEIDSASLGRLTGSAATAAVAICDKGFAAGILKKCCDNSEGE